MKKILLFILLAIHLQGCVFIGIKRTGNYVKKISKSFSRYEKEQISNELNVFYNNKKVTTDQLKGNILLISYTQTDSLINVVNNRLLKNNQNSDTIISVLYNRNNLSKEYGNPFQNKKIFNVLVDKNGRVVGTNIRKIESEGYQSDYYLDYAIYRIKDRIPLSESYYEYKWGVIYYHRWDIPSSRYPENIFGNWLKDQMEKKIITLN